MSIWKSEGGSSVLLPDFLISFRGEKEQRCEVLTIGSKVPPWMFFKMGDKVVLLAFSCAVLCCAVLRVSKKGGARPGIEREVS